MFTVLGGLLLLPSVALADRVVLLPPHGEASEEHKDHVEEALAVAIVAVGHESLTEAGAVDAETAELPTTGNELRGVAELQNAQYAVVARVEPVHAGRYRLRLLVGYAPEGRSEELEFAVLQSTEAARLEEVLRAMLRPEGLGDEGLRLTRDPEEEPGEPADESEQVEEEAASEEEPTEEAQREFLERERRRAEEEQRREQEAWEGRERHTDRGEWMASVGLDLRPLVSHDPDRTGGVLGGVSFRLGHRIGPPELELRGVFDIVSGAASGFTIGGGAVYLHSPLKNHPLFVGGGAELGFFQAVSGNRVPSFMVRVSPVAAYRIADQIYVEAALPELQILTANGGAVSLGVSIRAGARF